jgi:hypothetical protein
MANLFTYFDGAYCYFHDSCAKKMFEQKRFAGRHLLTFESQKLNYFGKKGRILYTSLVSLIMTLICLDPANGL